MVRLPRRGRPVELHLPVPWALLDLLHEGPAPLRPGGPERAGADALEIGVVVPPFRRGSGGHQTIAHLVRGLEAVGHRCSLWVLDDEGRHAGTADDELRRQFTEFFGPLAAPVRLGLAGWSGADVAVATGWQTVAATLRLEGAAGRAYLVQDHEPEFHGTSAERTWAEQSYGLGLHCIAASPWLAGLLRERYGASASSFDLGIDHDHYGPLPVHRRDDLLLVYSRAVTARRAVPLALVTAAEVHRRRPEIEIALFGDSTPPRTPFPARQLGVLDADALAHAYNSATVGLVLSPTNPSLVPTEMLACALPCVDLASPSMLATFGEDGPVALAAFDPLALADAILALVDDLEQRAARARAGLELAAERTWERAAAQIEEGLREALRRAG